MVVFIDHQHELYGLQSLALVFLGQQLLESLLLVSWTLVFELSLAFIQSGRHHGIDLFRLGANMGLLQSFLGDLDGW